MNKYLKRYFNSDDILFLKIVSCVGCVVFLFVLSL